jgi:hypothetical protein
LTTLANINANNLIEIPLIDSKWKYIGVVGGFCEGSTSTQTITSGWYQGTDNNESNDTLQTVNSTNTAEEYDANTDMIAFRIESNDGTINEARLGVDMTGHTYNATSASRITYASFDGVTTHLFLKYQSHFEGDTYQVRAKISNGEAVIYTGTFDETATSSSPQKLTAVSSECTDYSGYRLKIMDVLDMNLSNNPGKDGQSGDLTDYTKASNRDAKDNSDYLKVYRFDSKNTSWEMFDSRNSDAVNDFNTFAPGSSYWAYLYDETDNTNSHGFILGDGNLTSDSYKSTTALQQTTSTTSQTDHGLINAKWNMLAFEDNVIRYAPTGLYVTLQNASMNSGESFVISDGLGIESLTVELLDLNNSGSVTALEVAKHTNTLFAKAKAKGEISDSFNVKAFVSDSTHLVFISDAKFRVYDKNGSSGTTDDIFGTVKTIGNKDPLDLSVNGYTGVSNLGTTGVASKFGEYSLAIKPNNSAGNGTLTGPLANQIGKVYVNGTPIDLGSGSVSGVGDVGTAIVNGSDEIDYHQVIDTNFDGNADTVVLIDRNERFYVKDHTFTRFFWVDTNNSQINGNTIYLDDGKGNQYDVTMTAQTTANIVSTLNTVISNNNLSDDIKAVASGNYFAVFTDSLSYQYFDIKDSKTDDILTDMPLSTDALNMGAITNVYSLHDLATADVTKSSISFTINADNTDYDNNISISLQDGNTSDANTSDVTVTGYTYDAGLICTNLATAVNSLGAYVSGICSDQTDQNDTNVTFTMTGYFGYAYAEVESNGTATLSIGTNDNNITGGAIDSPDEVNTNLGFYNEWSSDFPTTESPLNFIKNAGYDLKFMMSAKNDSSGNIDWEYLDATQDVDDWFDTNNHSDLFKVNNTRGYWTYVSTSSDTNSTTMTNPSVSTSYFHHFNNETNNSDNAMILNISVDRQVTNSIKTGLIQVTLNNVQGTHENVVATINNKKIPLLDTTGNSIYNATFSSQDIYLSENRHTIKLEYFDELGNHVTDSSLSLDHEPPNTPTAMFIEPRIVILITSSSDTKAFHLYSGNIYDTDPAPTNTDGTNYVTKITADNDYVLSGKNFTLNGASHATSATTANNGAIYQSSVASPATAVYYLGYNICQETDFDDNSTGWRVIAVDNDGDPDVSRVSDISYIGNPNNDGETASTFYNFYKGASILASTSSNSYASDSSPRVYGDDCFTCTNQSDDQGVGLTSLNGNDVTIAYEAEAGADLAGSIATFGYIAVDGTVIAKIQFISGEYVTSQNTGLSKAKAIYVYHGGTDQIYRTTFDALATTDGTDANPVNFSSATDGIKLENQFISKTYDSTCN